MSKKLRITLFIDEDSMPELYRELANIPPRARAVRCRHLAMVGLVALKGDLPLDREPRQENSPTTKPEEEDARRARIQKVANKLLFGD